MTTRKDTPDVSAELANATPGVPNHLVESAPDSELFDPPKDYSAVGGPDTEAAYGRTRSVAGEYPFNANGGAHDRDGRFPPARGGFQTRHRIQPLATPTQDN